MNIKYSTERQASVVAKMQGGIRMEDLAQQESIPVATLYAWRKDARRKGILLPVADGSPAGWSARDKFLAVVETMAMSETEISAYCRKKGLFPATIAKWRTQCEEANGWTGNTQAELSLQLKQDRQKIRDLEREVDQKTRALSQTAVLLTLSKKAAAIWGGEEL